MNAGARKSYCLVCFGDIRVIPCVFEGGIQKLHGPGCPGPVLSVVVWNKAPLQYGKEIKSSRHEHKSHVRRTQTQVKQIQGDHGFQNLNVLFLIETRSTTYRGLLNQVAQLLFMGDSALIWMMSGQPVTTQLADLTPTVSDIRGCQAKHQKLCSMTHSHNCISCHTYIHTYIHT